MKYCQILFAVFNICVLRELRGVTSSSLIGRLSDSSLLRSYNDSILSNYYQNFESPRPNRGSPETFFTKVRETFEDVLTLDKIFSKHLSLLDRYLTGKLLPKESGPVLPIPKLALLPDLGVLRQLFHSGRENVRSTSVCHACRVGFALFLFKARTGLIFEELQKMTIFACKTFRIASSEVCTGLVELYAPILQYIAQERSELTPDRFCGIVLQSFGCIARDWENFEWKVDLEESNDAKSSRIGDIEDFDQNSYESMKIIHLADIHVDPHYVIGSNAVCENELCCRNPLSENEIFKNPLNRAGYYGDYRKCDLPYHSVENAFEHIATQHPDTELIYMTGDLVPHDVWTTDSLTNVEIIGNISKLLQDYFPNALVIPVIGNHESHPTNMFAPTILKLSAGFSPRWLYAAAAEAWKEWIPEDSVPTFLKSGYYTVKVRTNFRIIVINTNLCYGFNFWQLYSFKDPGNQLKWLTEVLELSRNSGEMVHIVGHIPPGQNECASTWSRNFYEIVNKFKDIVKSQFYGHTHYDEFQVVYDKVDKALPINTVFLGPSLSPFINLNPGYKVYFVDGARGEESSYHVIDSETWIYNLTQANADPEQRPQWYPLYRATEAYQLPNLLPVSLDTLVQRMSSNETIFEQYYKFYFKGTEESLQEKCDKNCRKRILCNIVTSFNEGQAECIELESGIDGVILPKRVFEKFRTIVVKPFEKVVINPFDKIVVKPLEKIGKKFVDIFKG